MSNDLERIRSLMALATGDEKHDPSAHSTLDGLWVLYERVLRIAPSDPSSDDRDSFLGTPLGAQNALSAQPKDRHLLTGSAQGPLGNLCDDGHCKDPAARLSSVPPPRPVGLVLVDLMLGSTRKDLFLAPVRDVLECLAVDPTFLDFLKLAAG